MEPGTQANDEREEYKTRRLLIPLLRTMLTMVVGMSLYQLGKFFLLPGLTLVESNIITVVFSSVTATVVAYFVLRKKHEILNHALRETAERKKAEEEILLLNKDLEFHVAQLEAANRELESFSYSVSHDLRAPLRHIAGYINLVRKTDPSTLDDKSIRYLDTIAESVKRMGNLIDDLLTFSRIGRTELQKARFSMEPLLAEVIRDLHQETEGRNIRWKIGDLPEIEADRSLFRIVLFNLLSNAVKFTSPRSVADIEVGFKGDHNNILFVRDNGVGFNMKYADKLFGVFQRLHSASEFDGTGIGLANVQRIIHRHGERIWGEGVIDKGATFYFTISNLRRGQET